MCRRVTTRTINNLLSCKISSSSISLNSRKHRMRLRTCSLRSNRDSRLCTLIKTSSQVKPTLSISRTWWGNLPICFPERLLASLSRRSWESLWRIYWRPQRARSSRTSELRPAPTTTFAIWKYSTTNAKIWSKTYKLSSQTKGAFIWCRLTLNPFSIRTLITTSTRN